MKRYAAGDFTDYRRPTIGADFMTKEVVEGDQPMLLQVVFYIRCTAVGTAVFAGADSRVTCCATAVAHTLRLSITLQSAPTLGRLLGVKNIYRLTFSTMVRTTAILPSIRR